MTTTAQTPWLINVLEAFRDVMNRGKAANTPDTAIDFPKPGGFKGRYKPFVWPVIDPKTITDKRIKHRAVVITGIIFQRDDGNRHEEEVIQAIAAYSKMAETLLLESDTDDSAFNRAFVGHAQPDGEGGLQFDGGKDFDGRLGLVDRWLVVGSPAEAGQPNA
ncbi:MAG: hypothetical protein AAGI37_06915 [Planctomycetota bacterium]